MGVRLHGWFRQLLFEEKTDSAHELCKNEIMPVTTSIQIPDKLCKRKNSFRKKKSEGILLAASAALAGFFSVWQRIDFVNALNAGDNQHSIYLNGERTRSMFGVCATPRYANFMALVHFCTMVTSPAVMIGVATAYFRLIQIGLVQPRRPSFSSTRR